MLYTSHTYIYIIVAVCTLTESHYPDNCRPKTKTLYIYIYTYTYTFISINVLCLVYRSIVSAQKSRLADCKRNTRYMYIGETGSSDFFWLKASKRRKKLYPPKGLQSSEWSTRACVSGNVFFRLCIPILGRFIFWKKTKPKYNVSRCFGLKYRNKFWNCLGNKAIDLVCVT